MAVTLVSTGITFPDSTTQTTAASASPATVVTSVNFSSTASVSWALDFSTYPGGYEAIWSRVVPSSSGVGLLCEFSSNGGSTYSALSSQNVSTQQGVSGWTFSNNVSGYFAYMSGQWQRNATGFSMTVQIAARDDASSTSALTLSGLGFMSAAIPIPIVAMGFFYTYGSRAFTNIRFTPSSGNFSSGSLRVLGYK